jgi:hypothetical protein
MKKIDMQAGGYVRYGTTILTVQYSTLQVGTLVVAHRPPAQAPVCDDMASYMYIHDVFLYSCCYAMLCRVPWWTALIRTGREDIRVGGLVHATCQLTCCVPTNRPGGANCQSNGLRLRICGER